VKAEDDIGPAAKKGELAAVQDCLRRGAYGDTPSMMVGISGNMILGYNHDWNSTLLLLLNLFHLIADQIYSPSVNQDFITTEAKSLHFKKKFLYS
jgi:hypothetical protein